MSKTFRGEGRERHKKNHLKFTDKRNKRTIVEDKREFKDFQKKARQYA